MVLRFGRNDLNLLKKTHKVSCMNSLIFNLCLCDGNTTCFGIVNIVRVMCPTSQAVICRGKKNQGKDCIGRRFINQKARLSSLCSVMAA